jgi:hypothetical protein
LLLPCFYLCRCLLLLPLSSPVAAAITAAAAQAFRQSWSNSAMGAIDMSLLAQMADPQQVMQAQKDPEVSWARPGQARSASERSLQALKGHYCTLAATIFHYDLYMKHLFLATIAAACIADIQMSAFDR